MKASIINNDHEASNTGDGRLGKSERKSSGFSLDGMQIKQTPATPVEVSVPAVPDGGYGWIIVFASFMCNFIVDGIANSFGMFLPIYAKHFKTGNAATAWVGSLLSGVYLLVGPLSSALIHKYGCRTVCIVGSCIGATGFAFSALSPSLGILMLTYGVIGGIGFGMIYLPAIVCVGYYFETKRALATGIAVCGSGVGTFVFPPMVAAMLRCMHWGYTNIILAGIVALCGVFALLMKPLEVQIEAIEEEKFELQHDNGKFTRSIISGLTYFTVQLPDGTVERRIKVTPDSITDENDPTAEQNSSLGDGKKKTQGSSLKFGSVPRFHTSTPQIGSSPFAPGLMLRLKAVPLGSSSNNIHGVISKTTITGGTQKGSLLSSAMTLSTSKARVNDQVVGSDEASIKTHETHLSLIADLKSEESEARKILRPLSRKDIFYSGSLQNLPEYSSATAVPDYKCLYSTISEETEVAAQEAMPPDHKESTRRCNRCISRGAFTSALRQLVDISLLNNPIFMLIAGSNILGMLGFFMPFVFIVSAATNTEGIKSEQAVLLLSIIGFTNTVGRVVTGFISDIRQINPLLLNNFCVFVGGVCVCAVPTCTTFAAYVSVAVCFGLFISGYIALTSIILVELLGIDKLTNAFGLLILFRGVSGIIASPIAGAVYDVFRSYEVPFYLGGSFLIASSILSSLVPLVIKPIHKNSPQIQADYQIEYFTNEEEKNEENETIDNEVDDNPNALEAQHNPRNSCKLACRCFRKSHTAIT